jgi:prepilin-type N-terminal cleavage/methylation domain-containing protein
MIGLTKKKDLVRGFTLIELLVTMFIAMVLMLTVFAQRSNYEKTLILNNNAYELGLAVREAQTKGVAVIASGAVSGRSGIYIPLYSSIVVVFNDTTTVNGHYDASSEKVRDIALDKSVYIGPLCGYVIPQDSWTEPTDNWTCNTNPDIEDSSINSNANIPDPTDMGSNPIVGLEILFVRPNPTPIMHFKLANGDYWQVGGASIELDSRSGGREIIQVLGTGYVSVD